MAEEWRELIHQLQRQSGEHYSVAEELRKDVGRLGHAVFGFGEGNTEHGLLGRIEVIEKTVERIDRWMEQEAVERKKRQQEMDQHNRRITVLITVFGLVLSTVAIVVPLVARV